MNEMPKNKKRIVSQGQYMIAQTNRFGLNIISVTLFVLAVVCGLGSLWDYLLVYRLRIPANPWVYIASFYWIMASVSEYGAVASLKRVRKIDPGIPVSRTSADSLPVEESLVRASDEPVQEQQAVLLRAATDNPETPAEQLVRPIEERDMQDEIIVNQGDDHTQNLRAEAR